MGLYYIGQKSRQVKRQTGLSSQFERIRQKKKAQSEQARLETARGGLLKVLQNRVEQNKPALPKGEETKTPDPGATPAVISNPPGPKEVTTNAGNNRSRGRDGQSGRK
jgi:hypothetical protein